MSFTLKVLATIFLLIVILLGGCLYFYNILCTTVQDFEQDLTAIENSIVGADWTNALTKLDALQDKWIRAQYIWSMFTDHYHVDAINTNFVRVAQFIKTKNQTMALAELATLLQLIKSVPENEAFNIKNIL